MPMDRKYPQRVLLANGEGRKDYIIRRRTEGAHEAIILAEINSADLYSGEPGKKWQMQIVDKALMHRVFESDTVPSIPDTDQLTPQEIEEAREAARARVMAKRKLQFKDQIAKEEELKLEAELGQIVLSGEKSDLVQITIDLPEFAPHVTLNSRAFWHGQAYRVPRHVYDTLRDVCARAWDHQREIDGKSRAMYKERGTKISGTGQSVGVQGLGR